MSCRPLVLRLSDLLGGRWIRLFGERTVYDRMEDGCRGIPVVSTDKHPPSSFEAACLDFIAAANPAVINSLLDRLEAAEADALEQARLNGMGASREAALIAKLEAAEKSDAESLEMYRRARDERDALRAALTDLLNDLEERAPLNIEKSPRVVACGNSVYVQAKAALEATP